MTVKRWVQAKAAATLADVDVHTIYRWARERSIRTSRTPGKRGRLRVGVDEDGLLSAPSPKRRR